MPIGAPGHEVWMRLNPQPLQNPDEATRDSFQLRSYLNCSIKFLGTNVSTLYLVLDMALRGACWRGV